MDNSDLWVLHWQLLSGAVGHGEPLTHEEAQAWLDKMTADYPDDLYWIEPIETEPPQ